jgi:fructose-bisphosphate aldolase, class II
MPLATPDAYDEMRYRAKAGGFAFPAINVTSSSTLNAALKGFADAGSDGIIQVSTGGGEFASGQHVKQMWVGALALAEYAAVVAEHYPVQIALHTDHCQAERLDGFLLPLLERSERRVAGGGLPIFNSHMFDGSALPLDRNLEIAAGLLERCRAARVVLEIEAGVVGGEEDGVEATHDAKLYTTDEDLEAVAEALGTGERGRYLLAATFGNVHGVYKPGNVVLQPKILRDGQRHVGAIVGKDQPFDYVFHGGSGSLLSEIREALGYGVVKMNVDTDMQYAYTRPVAGHMFTRYDGVLKVEGEVGDKKAYDPRTWSKLAEASMSSRVVQACEDLLSAGRSISA